jgi:hypothetical protein
MSYRIGASPADVDASRTAAEARSVLLAQFERFAAVVEQGARDIAGREPVVAQALRDAVPRLRRGMDNVLAGKLSVDTWVASVSGLVAQVRQEAPWFSVSSLMFAGDSLARAGRLAASAAAAAAVAVARTTGEVIKAGAEGAGLDPKETLELAASTTKWVAGAGITLGLAYLVFVMPKPSRK